MVQRAAGGSFANSMRRFFAPLLSLVLGLADSPMVSSDSPLLSLVKSFVAVLVSKCSTSSVGNAISSVSRKLDSR